MEDKIIKNLELLKQVENLELNKSIAIDSSYNVLKINNEAFDNFLNGISDGSKGNKILRLYGVLQALFVSIDALYTLSIGLTGTKNFLSLNQNKYLRELKYIRNDVVGHPTNRIVNEKKVYAILNDKKISDFTFAYDIYCEDDITTKDINLLNLIDVYFDETNHFLKSLISYGKAYKSNLVLDDVVNIYNMLIEDTDITSLLKLFKKSVKEEESRITKRINLLIRLNNDYRDNKTSLKKYVIASHIKALYEMVSKKDGQSIFIIRKPNKLQAAISYLKSNPSLLELTDNIYDINHPLFMKSINTLIKGFNKPNSIFEMIKEYGIKGDGQMVFAYGSILRDLK